jgi:hypothetical protein
MANFYNMWNQLDGKPQPTEFNLAKYDVSSNPINDVNSGYDLTPLSHEDMCRYAADDVVQHFTQLHKDRNPSSLGKPMTDSEFRKFMGIPEDEN